MVVLIEEENCLIQLVLFWLLGLRLEMVRPPSEKSV